MRWVRSKERPRAGKPGSLLRRSFPWFVLFLGGEKWAAFVRSGLDKVAAERLLVGTPDELAVLDRNVEPTAAVGVHALGEVDRLGGYSPQVVSGRQMVKTLFDFGGRDGCPVGRRRRLDGILEKYPFSPTDDGLLTEVRRKVQRRCVLVER